MQIRFLGHAAFELSNGEHTVLIDPFLTGNPKAAVSADDLNPGTILLTHGHQAHKRPCGSDRGDRKRARRRRGGERG
jgi:L-ascorbate metabolism protein UlaG (beta-lactamase superfamily)